MLLLSIIFLIVAVSNLIQSYQVTSSDLDSIPIAVSSLILITGSILYFYETIQNPEIGFIYSKPSFWVVVGIMIYFSGTFFLFLQYDNLSMQERDNFWIINIICFILKNIFFSISFILKPENQQISNVDDYYFKKLE
jgi:drug/metabolite transporter (DMT)-like permease